MRSIIELIIAVAIVAVFFVCLGFVLPASGRIERHIEIERPAIHVYDAVNSMRRIVSWGPWLAADPLAEYEFSGPIDGAGGKAIWTSSVPSVGTGSHEVLDGGERERSVRLHLNLGPNRDGAGLIKIEPLDVGVKVSMSYDVKFNGLLERYRGLYLDSELGDKLNLALASLKAMLENSPYAADYAEAGVEERELTAGPALQLTQTSRGYAGQELNIPRDRAVAFEKLAAFNEKNGLVAGPPQFMELSRDPVAYVVTFDATIPVDKTEGVKLAGDIKAVTTAAGKYIVAKHIGERDSWHLTGQTKDKILAYASVRGINPSAPETGRKIFVEFISPDDTPVAVFETAVYVPVE